MDASVWYQAGYFHCAKYSVLYPFIPSSLPQTLGTTDIFIGSIVLPFPEDHIIGNNMQTFPMNSVTCIKIFSMSFPILRVPFCTIVYLFIFLLKDILLTSKFW